MQKMITVWKNGTYQIWNETDAIYAANDPDWLVNIPSNPPEVTTDIITWLKSANLDSYSQFTIDWTERIISDADDRIERSESLSWKDEEGAILYEAKNVLEVMKDIPDVEFFRQILSKLHNPASNKAINADLTTNAVSDDTVPAK